MLRKTGGSLHLNMQINQEPSLLIPKLLHVRSQVTLNTLRMSIVWAEISSTNSSVRCLHTNTHAYFKTGIPPVVFSHWGNLMKLCQSLHAEQGITMRFSPQESQEPAKSSIGLHPPPHLFHAPPLFESLLAFTS